MPNCDVRIAIYTKLDLQVKFDLIASEIKWQLEAQKVKQFLQDNSSIEFWKAFEASFQSKNTSEE